MLDDDPVQCGRTVKLLNCGLAVKHMKICSICHRISGSGEDHLDCVERRRVELEDDDLDKTPERLDVGTELASEIRAVIEHMAKERERSP